ncbi:MAG: PP2C family protein-serine/threonine phosphatase [Planctomycetota bacterium]
MAQDTQQAPAIPQRTRSSARPAFDRDSAAILVGVFFTFAPIGLLMQMVPDRPGNLLAATMSAVISGSISVAWAATFITRRFWMLALIIPLQLIVPTLAFGISSRMGWLGASETLSSLGIRLTYGFTTIVSMVVGYVLMIRFVRRLERQGERDRTELEMAEQIHRALVPPIDIREPGIEVHGRSKASSSMGGDLIDAIPRTGGLDVYVVDVSGHGVKAGVVMGMVKAAIRTRLQSAGSPREVAQDLSRVLADTIEPGMFATFIGIQIKGLVAELSLAGHPPVLRSPAGGGPVEELPNEHLPLAIDPDEQIISRRVDLAVGDLLVLYTDGLTEVMDPSGRLLGIAGFKALVASQHGKSLEEISRSIFEAADRFGPREDDQSLVLIRIGSALLDPKAGLRPGA